LEKRQAEANSSSPALSPGTDAKNKDSSCKSSIVEHGIWRVVHSEKYNAPFFFNSTSNTGQFKVPPELIGVYDCSLPKEGITSSTGVAHDHCSPTQQKWSMQQEDGDWAVNSQTPPVLRDAQGIVFGTYPGLSATEEKAFQCGHEEDGDSGDSGGGGQELTCDSNVDARGGDGVHSDYPCTLVDSQDALLQSPPSDALITSKPNSNSSFVSNTSILVSDTPPDSDSGHDGKRLVYAHNSSYDIATAISQQQHMNGSPSIPSSEYRKEGSITFAKEDDSEDPKEGQNECPFCTFINPPMSLVCEICLGEMTQVTVSAVRFVYTSPLFCTQLVCFH
jgi:hypothetical protein